MKVNISPRVRNILKWLGIITIVDLLYLNILLPIVLSFEQILLIALEVVYICDKKNIEISSLSSTQLDELINLSISSVKEVFKKKWLSFYSKFIATRPRCR